MLATIQSGRLSNLILRGLSILLLLGMVVASVAPTVVVRAVNDPTATPAPTPVPPPAGNPDPDDLMTTILNAFKGLASAWFFFAYSLMAILFVVGFVRSALFMQGAQAFGFTQGMSREMVQIAGGIACFAIAMISFPLANWIMNQLTGLVPTTWDIKTPPIPTQ